MRTLIEKDLRRWWSDRTAVVVALVLPLVLTGILGLSFGGFGGEAGISTIPLAVVGDVPSMVRDFIDNALDETGVFNATWMSRDFAEEQVRTGKIRAALIIPDDFAERYFAGEAVQFTLWKDINSEFKAGIVEQILERMLLYIRAGEATYIGAWPDDFYPENAEESAIARLLEGDSFLEVYKRIREGSTEAGDAWTQMQTIMDHQVEIQDAFSLQSVDLTVSDRGGEELAANEAPQASRNMFDYFLPGMAVFFLMFAAAGAGSDIHREREGGTLQRMLVTPLKSRDLLLGKWIFATVNGLLQLVILFAVGKLVYGLNLGPDPFVLLVQALLTSASLASVFLVLSMLMRTEKQMGQFGTGVILFMAMIGGNFIATDFMPGFLRAAARFTPNYWANDGFATIISQNEGLGAVTTNLAVLGVIAVVFLILAMLLLHVRERKGELL